MPHHRHLDQDELFLVYSGTISLESDWGTAILRPGELAVAPKGVGHRSSSLLRSQVLLLQPRLLVNRRNGDRRIFSPKNQGRLEKVNVPAVGRNIIESFRPIKLADVDTFALTLTLCQGVGPWLPAQRQESLVLCLEGSIALDIEQDHLQLEYGELVVVPRGVSHRLSCTTRGLVVGLQRHKQPGLPIS
jgi:quercetin dioxygenase-like cupin family protein